MVEALIRLLVRRAVGRALGQATGRGRGVGFVAYVVASLVICIFVLARYSMPLGPSIVVGGGFLLFTLLVWNLMTPRIRSGYGHRARAAQVREPALFAAPGELPAGRCWQCGKRMRDGDKVCGGCGATRFTPPVPTVVIPQGTDLPPGTFEQGKQAEMYVPGRPGPLSQLAEPADDATFGER